MGHGSRSLKKLAAVRLTRNLDRLDDPSAVVRVHPAPELALCARNGLMLYEAGPDPSKCIAVRQLVTTAAGFKSKRGANSQCLTVTPQASSPIEAIVRSRTYPVAGIVEDVALCMIGVSHKLATRH